MALTQPLDLWDLFVVKLAGQDNFLSIFMFLCLIVISIMAARFRMTAMSLFAAIGIFAFIMYQSTNNAGSFGILVALAVTGFTLMMVIALKDKFQ